MQLSALTNEISVYQKQYEVIVVGAGHAGCEAALASARLGAQTLLLTINLDRIAWMPCNPSIGGPAKSQLVHEIDALGGQMAINTDKTYLQIKMLNTSKGPAVQSLRAQSDKFKYHVEMKRTLENQKFLDIKEAMVRELILDNENIAGVVTEMDVLYLGKKVILCNGTFLNGKIHIGMKSMSAGRAGEFPSINLAEDLKQYFETAINFIEKARLSGNVLIHCFAGISRSASILIAYLMKMERMDLNSAFRVVKERRWKVNPNHGFLGQLEQYEKEVRWSGWGWVTAY